MNVRRTLEWCAAAAIALSASLTAQGDYTLTIVIQGQGSVTLDPPGGSYPPGTVVEVRGFAKPYWHLHHWAGVDAGQENSNPAEVTMTGDKTVTAYFKPSSLMFHDSQCPFNDPTYKKQGGEVNISGATLFQAFFESPASTNDIPYHEVPGNPGIYSGDWNCDGHPDDPYSGDFDQLAASFSGNWTGWWLVQYRGVGSGNGLHELVRSQLTPGSGRPWWVPEAPPVDLGLINRFPFSVGGYCQGTYGCNENFNLLLSGGLHPCCGSCTPYCPIQVDLAVLDVPTRWFVRQPGTTAWDRKPGEPGYGSYPIKSWDYTWDEYAQTWKQQSNTLKSLCLDDGSACLNTNTTNPDQHTVYDTAIAWVPIAIIANVGTGLENVKVSDLQYLFLTGRMPSGENLVAATRDAGSGTRNGGMNCLCIDPSWARGDNLGLKTENSATDNLGPIHQATNKGGSSRMEAAVQNRRLACGQTGLIGSSRAAADAVAGNYEILNVMFDVLGGERYCRPSLDNILHNCLDEPNADVWLIGGDETFTSVGDPLSGRVGHEGNPEMRNEAAGDYLRNIHDSISIFDPWVAYGSPAEYLASTFILSAAVDCSPALEDPCTWIPQNVDPALQQYTAEWNPLFVPEYGYTSPIIGSHANKVPIRQASPNWSNLPGAEGNPDVVLPPNNRYSDGSTTNYCNFIANYTINGGIKLSDRNKIMGDFYIGADPNNPDPKELWRRNWNDIPAMMAAIYDPRAFVQNEGLLTNPIFHQAAIGDGSYVIPEIIGDFNGDGNFGRVLAADGQTVLGYDKQDARYFADGLALDPATGLLNRKVGFIMVDEAWNAVWLANEGQEDINFFDTSLGNIPKPYKAGDSRGDVAGDYQRNPNVNSPYPGAHPHGHDGIIDGHDIDYVYANFGNWHNLEEAVHMDLSCDMNGDLRVNRYDVYELVYDILCTEFGDVNLDGYVDESDINIILANLGQPGGWADGDLNGDGVVNALDLQIAQVTLGFAYNPTYYAEGCCGTIPGDMNGDGVLDGFDIQPFAQALVSGQYNCAADVNRDGVVDGFDIQPFVNRLVNGFWAAAN